MSRFPIRDFIRHLTPASVHPMLTRLRIALLDRSAARLRVPPASLDSTLSAAIAYNRFGGYCVPRSSIHRPACQTILRGEVWEPDTINFITSNCSAGDVVHAGTYFGDFLPALSAATVSSGAKLWAFEPNYENFRCAQITAYLNNLSNLTLTNAGLGEQHGSATMTVKSPDGRPMGGGSNINTSTSTPQSSSHTQPVAIVAIDDIIPPDRNVSLIQLDVEYYEKQALTGARKTIARCRPILILETLPDQSWLAANILSLGYKISHKVHTNTVFKPTA